jgi:AAA domain
VITKNRDINDIHREEGGDAARDFVDSAELHEKPGASNKANGGTDKHDEGDTEPLVQTVSEFVATLDVSDYLIDGLFKRGFLYSLTAKTGGGKTAVAILAAIAVADPQRRWRFGPYETEHGRVIYVTRENPTEVKERLIGIADTLGFDTAELDKTFLVIHRVTDIAKAYNRIKREIANFGNTSFIILDTSAALFVGDDENSSTEMLKHAKTQRMLTELPGHPCVLALNHPIKNPVSPEQLLPRGGGSYLNEVDGNFTLWARDDRLSDFYWTGKIRGPDFEKITFRMVTIMTEKLKDSKGRLMPTVMARLVTEADVAEAETKSRYQEDRLLNVIAKNPEGSIADWAIGCEWFMKDKKTGADQPYKSLVTRVVARLKEGKMIEKEGRGYVLSKTGKAILAKGAPK